jgi:hypothetical protein
MKWIDLQAMSPEEIEEFVWSRIRSEQVTCIALGLPFHVWKEEHPDEGPLEAFFIPDPGGNVLVLPTALPDKWVIKPSEDTWQPTPRRYICLLQTGASHWKGSEGRNRFPVSVLWDETQGGVVARLWDDPDAEKFILRFDLSVSAENDYLERKQRRRQPLPAEVAS